MMEASAREEMCEIGRRLWQRGLVGATQGNLSCRLDESRILCTPTGVSKGHLEPQDLLVIDPTGKPLGAGHPSSEIKMHLGIYHNRADCIAIVHAHPPVATGFALAGQTIPDNVLPEAMIVLGSVALVPFCMPGTDDVPNAIQPFLARHKAFLLCNHGAVTLGKTLMDAFNRMEMLERIATVVMHARQVGDVQPVPHEAFEELKKYLNGEL